MKSLRVILRSGHKVVRDRANAPLTPRCGVFERCIWKFGKTRKEIGVRPRHMLQESIERLVVLGHVKEISAVVASGTSAPSASFCA